MIRSATLMAALTALCLAGPPVAAQNLFAPRVIVNDKAITNYEVRQRMLMLRLFRAEGDIEEEALKALIEDRLRLRAAEEMDIEVAPEQIVAGMEEFAARANLTGEQFVEALAQGGVSAESFRDFVRAGLVWREVVRARFGSTVQITDVEVDRAMSSLTQGVNTRVLLSEIRITVEQGNESAALSLTRSLQGALTTEEAFSQAARRYSDGPTAGNGGRLNWMALSDLPEDLQTQVLSLAPGRVAGPVRVEDDYVIYQMREMERRPGQTARGEHLEYAQFILPAGTAGAQEAAKIRSRVDTCDDLYAQAQGLPADRLLRETRPQGQIPADIAAQLARLDANEIADFPRGGAHVLLMLCSRLPDIGTPPSRDEIRNQLRNQRLSAMSDAYLEELRADALIREP
ncbi:MAG: peptidylprolyl isomerase [Pseudorhodobacter sp.]